ncbi:unnamed protein product (macronuclear) [Paramecium tetraurelia]|uniref:Protein kinase domain-containing protein n=1 Tax=Paramecium tetraurelia TaxID=5888 RepID=A0CXG1_PARTE|nr:uncharacterized protein GSPATT00011110001 [Paramecium tetraurelia]CAK75478.1 unnamed protein product [Paramecium tetraurelia]|eukprot:XP_001442875.1 hypothetical protein (macronuclear) [Paramecium tetraurelia strain d4-2]
MKSIKKNIENLYPQFTVVEVLRYNKFKKTIILRRVNQPYILRLYSLEGVNKDKVISLIQLINKLSKTCSPHIAKFYEASHDANNTYLGVISQYIDTQYQCPLNEQEILYILIQACSAIELFHPKHSHGKISLSNLFCSQKTTILGDMNILYYLHQDNYQDIYLLAPEFVKQKIYDCKSDIWMLGVLVYQLMFKEQPFKANNINVLHRQILKGIKFIYHPQYSLNLNNLLRILLSYDPELRPTISSIRTFAEQALISSEKCDIFQILPKYKVDQVILQKKKKDSKRNVRDTQIYLNDQTLKYPSFKPSKILKQEKKIYQTNPSPQRQGENSNNNDSSVEIQQQFPTLQLEQQIESKKNLSFTEKYSQSSKKKLNYSQSSQKQQQISQESLYPVQLPKVLQYSFNKIKFRHELSPTKFQNETDYQEKGPSSFLQYQDKHVEQKIRRSPPKMLFHPYVESAQRSFSQRQ